MEESRRAIYLFAHLHHDVRDLHIFLGLVLGRHLKNDILLVLRHGLLADVLDKLAHPVQN